MVVTGTLPALLMLGLLGCHGGGRGPLDAGGPATGDGSEERDSVLAAPADSAPETVNSDDLRDDVPVTEGGALLPDAAPTCTSIGRPTPSQLGFSKALPQASGRILAVQGNVLTLAFESGATVEYVWSGPDLSFKPGDSVVAERICRSLQARFCWDVLRGPNTTAAAWLESGLSEGRAADPAPLDGAPGVGLRFACSAADSSPACGGDLSLSTSVFNLGVQWQGTSIEIAEGATGTIGSWQVTNVFAKAGTGGASSTCTVDGGFVVGVTMLGGH
jgi:hypothetical protein